MRAVTILTVGLLLVPQAALAVITFTQLDSNLFVVSHRIKVIGSRGRAMKLVYEKAASLCIAAGYTHFKIVDQESNAGQQYESANASIRVRLFLADDEERIECENSASSTYVEQAGEKLSRMGYQPPDPDALAQESAESEGDTGDCTVAQITAMVKAELSEEQIQAACGGEG